MERMIYIEIRSAWNSFKMGYLALWCPCSMYRAETILSCLYEFYMICIMKL